MKRLVILALVLAGCARHPSIVGKYKDDDYLTGGRQNLWEFKDDGTFSTDYQVRNHSTGDLYTMSLLTGSYELKEKSLTFHTRRIVFYNRDGSVRRDQSVPLTPDMSEVNSFAIKGKDLLLDAENKTREGHKLLVKLQ